MMKPPNKWGNYTGEGEMAWAAFAPGKGFFSSLGTERT